MAGNSRGRISVGGALVVALVGLSGAGPAAATDAGPDADGAGSPVVEVIVSAPVDAGQAPQFDVVRTDLAGLVDLLESVDEDERVEWNGTATLTFRPDDPGFAHGAPAQRASLAAAWDTTRGSADVVIAVLDTGVTPGPEFGARLLPGASMIGADPHVDPFGHGTPVAKAAAAAHDGIGAAGVCPRCLVLPVQVADTTGSVGWSAAAEGIVWAVDHGADIINLSFGGQSTPSVVREAVAYAVANDVVVVASAGNFGDDAPFYPAALDGVIAVGAHDDSFGRYQWSSFGDWVDVAAPGCLHDVHGTGTLGCGTSFSAPWISGVVGLLSAAQGPTSPATTEALLESVAAPLTWVETGWIAPGELFARQFLDVNPSSYYAQPVAWLVANDITTGTTPTTYAPDAPVTRAQLATFLYRLAANDSHNDDTPTTATTDPTFNDITFNDIDPSSYYAQPVAWLVANDITTGTTPTTYAPDAPVTRAQLATFLYRLAA